MAVRSGNRKTIATRYGQVLPRNRALGPRSTGLIYDLLGTDVTTRPVSVLADTGLQIAAAVVRDADCAALVFAAFETPVDIRVDATELIGWDADVAIRVSTLLASELDAMMGIFGALGRGADVGIAVANALEQFPDVVLRVSWALQTQSDAHLTVTAVVDRRGDVCLDITDAGLANADLVLTITRPVSFAADTHVFVLRRLAPDADTDLRVYALLIEESHPIQV